jgi:hypothetical protein
VHLDIFGLALQNHLQIDFSLRLLALAIFTDDNGVLQFGDIRQSTSQRQDLERGKFGAVV